MNHFIKTGEKVLPGDVLFSSLANSFSAEESPISELPEASELVQPGEGCYVSFVSTDSSLCERSIPSSSVVRCLIASKKGIAQWDGAVLSVFSGFAGAVEPALPNTNMSFSLSHQQNGIPSESPTRHKRLREGEASESLPLTPSQTAWQLHHSLFVSNPGVEIITKAGRHQDVGELGRLTGTGSVVGPRAQDIVHVRITRITRTLAVGEIIAIRHQWCRHSTSLSTTTATASTGVGAAFRGVLRMEDIRPFRPTRDVLHPPSPALSFSPGDVVIGVVISQSDARQYQLSTLGESCGVVQSVMRTNEDESVASSSSSAGEGSTMRCLLEHVPGRRDVMRHPLTDQLIPKWCPLIPL